MIEQCNIPHIYALAQSASKNLRLMKKSQVCLISGESGAGKTETAKQFMNHLLCFSGDHGSTGSQSALERKILESQPLLESFGNAKTGLNDNSSRFGKFMEVVYDSAGDVLGARIQKYLLEKVRVVSQSPGETNYHIFFYCVSGAPPAIQSQMKSLPAHQYKFLSPCESTTDDAERYKELIGTMTVLGFEDDEIEEMQMIISAVLLAGNLEFIDSPGATDDSSEFADAVVAEDLAQLLMVDREILEDALTTKHIVTAGETFHKPLNADQAREARDTFAQNTYDNLFSWVTSRLNQILGDGLGAGTSVGEMSVGVLDIFGFENFKTNSFEQLCINTANEQLQYFFNQHIFKWEIDEMKREGIRGQTIEFTDNADQVAMLLGTPNGIYAMMDEQAKIPKSNDDTCLSKFHSQLSDKPCYDNLHQHREEFKLSHYAGDVTYQVKNFVLKNRNAPSLGVVGMMQTSTMTLCKAIYQSQESTNDRKKGGGIQKGKTFKQRASKFFGRGKSKKMSKKGVNNFSGTRTRKARAATLGGEFRLSLQDLMAKLETSMPHFVRCIKPNLQKKPGVLDQPMVGKQLKYTGVMETTKIRAQGYPLRLKFEDFIDRYRSVCYPPNQKLRPDPSTCQRILQAAGCHGWQRGKTKLFLKYPHIKALVAILDKKAAEEADRLEAIAEATRKREADEKAFEDRRLKQVEEIRRNAEATSSTADTGVNASAVKVAALAKKPKPNKLPPKPAFLSGGGGGDGASSAKEGYDSGTLNSKGKSAPPVAEKKMSRRGTGMKGRKFNVGALASRFAHSGSGPVRRSSSVINRQAAEEAAKIAIIDAQNARVAEEKAAADAKKAADVARVVPSFQDRLKMFGKGGN
jgi:myosin-3